jgi:tetratricopeptide (TPR) repeat protein
VLGCLLGAALLLSGSAHAADRDALLGPETAAPPKSALVPWTPPPPPPSPEQLQAGGEAALRDPKALVRYLEADPSRLTVEGRTPAEVLGFAQVLLRLEEVFLAERLLFRAHEKWPEDADVAAARGRVLVSLGRPEAARRTLDEALARRPDDPTLHYLRGRALLGMEPRTPEVEGQAAAAFEKTLQLAPDFTDPDGVTAPDLRNVIGRLRAGAGPGPQGAP